MEERPCLAAIPRPAEGMAGSDQQGGHTALTVGPDPPGADVAWLAAQGRAHCRPHLHHPQMFAEWLWASCRTLPGLGPQLSGCALH